MSTTDPDEIRQNIEVTRSNLEFDVDALTDKVTPSKIVHRQSEKVRGAFGAARDRVMGATPSAGELGDRASTAGQQAVDKVQGSPLAVGLIAFGAGLLAAALIPSSRTEQRAASQVKDAAAPALAEVKDAAQGVAEDLRGPAQDAANTVKDAATGAASGLKDDAQGAVSDVRDQAHDATSDLREQ